MENEFDLLNSQLDGDEWRRVVIPYNGHGNRNKEDKNCGQMCLAEGQSLTVVEIINLMIKSYKKSGGKSKDVIFIKFFLDNCYGGGQYLDVCDALQNG